MSMMDGLAGRQALGADMALREAQIQQQQNAILIREQNLAQERNLLRVSLSNVQCLMLSLTGSHGEMRQMEDQAYLQSQATISSYGLSSRLNAFDGPMLDPYQLPALVSIHLRNLLVYI